MADQPIATGETLNTVQVPPVLSKPKKSWFKKILKVILILVVISLTPFFIMNILPYFFSIVTSDIAPPNVDDLKFETLNIPKEDNAYYDLLAFGGSEVMGTTTVPIKATVTIYTTAPTYEGSGDLDNHLNGKEWDQKFVEDIVSKNSDAYVVFDKAASKPKYQNPNTDSSKGMSNSATILGSLNSYRGLAKVEAIRALYLFRQGKEEEGMNEAVKIIKFGQKIQDSQDPLITYLVSLAIKNTGLNALTIMVEKTTLPSDKLIYYVKEIDRFKNNKKGFITGLRGEYATNAAFADTVLPQLDIFERIKETYYFRPNETKQLLAEWVRGNIKYIDTSCIAGNERDKKLMEQNKELNFGSGMPPFSIKSYFDENHGGKVVSVVIASSLNTSVQKRCNEEFRVSVSQLLMAIKAYKIDKGDYPPSLDSLVPNYIESVPNDPYSNQPIKYSLSKKIIYSVGKDGVDAGGSEGEDWQKMLDPTFKISF